MQGVTHILAYPKESTEAIAKGVMDFVNDKIIKGTPEDRACVVGQVVFEAATWLAGVGEAKNAKAVASIDALEGLNIKAIEKILKRLDDINLEKALKNLSDDQIDTLLKECDSKLAEKIKKVSEGGSAKGNDYL